jgi:hypothetical protein
MAKTNCRSTPMLTPASVGLCIMVAACSGGTGPAADARTLLFTNALGIDYAAVTYDETSPVRLDTALYVPMGAQVCLRLSSTKLNLNDVVGLASFDGFGNVIGTALIRPILGSWTWDGAARNATVAPPC